RVFHVTGVQTWALPILSSSRCSSTRKEIACVAETLLRHSPLAHLGLAAHTVEQRGADQGVALAELPYRAAVSLRGRLTEPGLDEGVEAALGCALPARVGEVAKAGE